MLARHHRKGGHRTGPEPVVTRYLSCSKNHLRAPSRRFVGSLAVKHSLAPHSRHARAHTEHGTTAVRRDFPRHNDRVDEATKTSAGAGRDAGGDSGLPECVGLCAAARLVALLPLFFRISSSSSSCANAEWSASSRASVPAASQPAETGAATRRVPSLVLLRLLLLCSRWRGADRGCCSHGSHGRLGTKGRGGDRDVFFSGLGARRSRPAHGRRPAGAAVGRPGHRGQARLQGDTGIGELFLRQKGEDVNPLAVGWMQLPHNCQAAETSLLGVCFLALYSSSRGCIAAAMDGCSSFASAGYGRKAASRACISLSTRLGEGATQRVEADMPSRNGSYRDDRCASGEFCDRVHETAVHFCGNLLTEVGRV